jgi:hypothetical protein
LSSSSGAYTPSMCSLPSANAASARLRRLRRAGASTCPQCALLRRCGPAALPSATARASCPRRPRGAFPGLGDVVVRLVEFSRQM